MIECGYELIGIQVKATSAPWTADIDQLRVFRGEYGDTVRGCLLLHAEERVGRQAPRILSAPWWRVV